MKGIGARILNLIKNFTHHISSQRGSRSQLRSFAYIMAVFSGLFTVVFWYYEFILGQRIFTGLITLLILFGVFKPVLLQPFYICWMFLARILAFINTHIILAFIFYTLFTVIGLLLRFFRNDPLDRDIENETVSYWQHPEQEKLPRDHFDRQF